MKILLLEYMVILILGISAITDFSDLFDWSNNLLVLTLILVTGMLVMELILAICFLF